MSTGLSGDFSIAFTQLQIQLAAQDLLFKVTLTAEPGRAWKYNLSEVRKDPDNHQSRAAYGRVIAPDYQAATRVVARAIGYGFEAGTVERGLFDVLASADMAGVIGKALDPGTG